MTKISLMAAKRKGARGYQMKRFATFTTWYVALIFCFFHIFPFFFAFSIILFCFILFDFSIHLFFIWTMPSNRKIHILFLHISRESAMRSSACLKTAKSQKVCERVTIFFLSCSLAHSLTLNLSGRSKFSISSSYGNIERYE